MSEPWDPGLQPERTELAWRRTILAVTTGSVVSARFLSHEHTVFGLVLPAAALVIGALVLWRAQRRARTIDAMLKEAAGRQLTARMPGAGLLAAVVALATATVLAGAAYVLMKVTGLV